MTAPKATTVQPPSRGRGRPDKPISTDKPAGDTFINVRLDEETRNAVLTLERLWGGRHPRRADLIRDGLKLAAEVASKKSREGG